MTSITALNESNATDVTDLQSDTVNATLSTETAIMSASGTSHHCAVVDFVFKSVFQMFLVLFGLVGNTLSMLVFWMMTPQTPTSLLNICLAVFDNAVLVFYFLLTSVNPVCKLYKVCLYFTNTIMANLSPYLWPFGTMANMGGTFVVVTLTYHRYIRACHPHLVARLANMRIARCQLAAILVFVIIFNIPRFLDDGPYQLPNSTQTITRDTALGADIYYQLVYAGVMYYIVSFGIPFLLLIFMTHKLICSLKMFYLKRDQMTRAKHDENSVNHALVVIVVVFMTCQILNPMRRILSAILPAKATTCGSFYYYFGIMAVVAVTFEASLHFLLYCTFDRRFRRKLRHWTAGAASTTMITPLT